MPPSIKDIAAACGVSDVTVSRVLNAKENIGSIRIGEETRQRVMSAAQALGYRPNRLAQKLARGGSQILGFVTAIPNDSFAASVMAGIQHVCKARDMLLTLCPASHRKAEVLPGIGAFLAQHGADTIIVESHVTMDRQAAVVAELSQMAKRVVFVDQEIVGAHSVFSDDVAGMKSAVDYLLSLGHRRIALACPDFSSTGRKRLQGYTEGMQGAGLSVDEDLIVPGEYSEDCGRVAVNKLLSLDNPPTAIIGASDVVAIGAMRELIDKSISIPDYMSLMGYSDLAWTDLLGLTTVRQPAFEMGVEAARIALGITTGSELRPIHKALDTKLIIRSTCKSRLG